MRRDCPQMFPNHDAWAQRSASRPPAANSEPRALSVIDKKRNRGRNLTVTHYIRSSIDQYRQAIFSLRQSQQLMRTRATQRWELRDGQWIDITEQHLAEIEVRLGRLYKFLALYERSETI